MKKIQNHCTASDQWIRILLISSLTFKTPTKKLYFCLLHTFWSYIFLRWKIRKKSQNSRSRFFLLFLLDVRKIRTQGAQKRTDPDPQHSNRFGSGSLLTNKKQGNLGEGHPLTLLSQRKLVINRKKYTFCVIKSLEHLINPLFRPRVAGHSPPEQSEQLTFLPLSSRSSWLFSPWAVPYPSSPLSFHGKFFIFVYSAPCCSSVV